MLNAQMYLDKHTIVHKVEGCSFTNMHTFKQMEEHTAILPVFLPLLLGLLIVLYPNLSCLLTIHLKSFSSLNKILCLSLCLAPFLIQPFSLSIFCSFFSLPDQFLTFPVIHLHFPAFPFPFFFPLLYRLSVWNWWMGWDYSLQSGGGGRESEAWWCSGLYLDYQGSSSVQGQYKGPY